VGHRARHDTSIDRNLVGRVLAKGSAGHEMGERVYVVVDGVDGRVHYMEFAAPSGIEEVRRGMIVEAAAPVFGSRSADRNIALNAQEDGGTYQPSRHLARIRDSFERQGKDPEAFVHFHVRRLEALRRGQDMWSGLMTTIGGCRTMSSSGDRLTTEAKGTTACASASSPALTWSGRSQATAPGWTANWSPESAYRSQTQALDGKSEKRSTSVCSDRWRWATPQRKTG
jgi:hypothetical protein